MFWKLRRNPYPLVLMCLRESGITAFFTRSSAANIPVNLALSKRLGLHEDTYSVSIPLGATINMAGAAITITVLTLAAVHTLGIAVDLPTAVLLSVVAAICACGASGVAGGSLLLIPLACSLFGISERNRHAGGGGRLHHRCVAGFGGNRARTRPPMCCSPRRRAWARKSNRLKRARTKARGGSRAELPRAFLFYALSTRLFRTRPCNHACPLPHRCDAAARRRW